MIGTTCVERAEPGARLTTWRGQPAGFAQMGGAV